MKVSALVLVCVLGSGLGFEDKTVVQWLIDNNFNTLVTAVTTAGLATALSDSGPFTVFAPTDAAFNKLGAATIQNLLANPAQLAIILKYHVVNKFVLVPMVNGPTMETTLSGGSLDLAPHKGALIINNASVVDPSKNDIVCNNGVIHAIDTVLIPPNLPSLTITQYLLQDDARFRDLVLALTLNQLTGALESGEFTLFAPVDSAFASYRGPSLGDDPAFFAELLKYHVVPGARMASQLSNGQVLFSLQGTPLNVTINSSGVMINNAKVIDPDLLCTNGVIHAIDTVLIPATAQSSSG